MLECTCIPFSHLMENLTYPHNSWHVFQALSYYPPCFWNPLEKEPYNPYNSNLKTPCISACQVAVRIYCNATCFFPQHYDLRKESFASTWNRPNITGFPCVTRVAPIHLNPTLWPAVVTVGRFNTSEGTGGIVFATWINENQGLVPMCVKEVVHFDKSIKANNIHSNNHITAITKPCK